MMKAGENTSTKATAGVQRVKYSMKVHNHGHAPLCSLRKDHKVTEDEVLGPLLGRYVEAVRHIITRCHTF